MLPQHCTIVHYYVSRLAFQQAISVPAMNWLVTLSWGPHRSLDCHKRVLQESLVLPGAEVILGSFCTVVRVPVCVGTT